MVVYANWRSNIGIILLSMFLGFQVNPFLTLTGFCSGILMYTSITARRDDSSKPEYMGKVLTISGTASRRTMDDMSIVGIKVLWTISIMISHHYKSLMMGGYWNLMIMASTSFGIIGAWVDDIDEKFHPYHHVIMKSVGFRMHELVMILYGIFETTTIYLYFDNTFMFNCVILFWSLMLFITNILKSLNIPSVEKIMNMTRAMVFFEWTGYAFIMQIILAYYYHYKCP